jgi:outer membrane protein with beta-barrel domain
MKVRVLVLAAVSVLLLTRPAASQKAGTIELGGFGRFTDYDNSLAFSNKVGFGGRVGIFLPARFSIEGDLSTTSNDLAGTSAKYTPMHLMLLYNYPLAESSVLVGGGYARNKYKYAASDTTDNGVAIIVGVRYRIQQMVALRLDLNEDFIPSPANQGPSTSFNGNLGMQLGVSLLISFLK